MASDNEMDRTGVYEFYICAIMSHICHAQKLKEFHMSLVYLDKVCNLWSIGYIKTVLPSNRKKTFTTGFDQSICVYKPLSAMTDYSTRFSGLITEDNEVNTPITTDRGQNHATAHT
jgi:hypothetical protein